MNISKLKNRVTAEHALLLFFLIVGLFFLIESRHLSDRGAVFPQFTAAATVIGSLLLLFRSYLPWPLSVFVEEQEGMFEDTVDDEMIEEIEEKSEQEAAKAVEQETADIEESDESVTTDEKDPVPEAETRYVEIAGYELHGALFTVLATIGFIGLGYLIGLLWAAPIFVAGYLTALERPKRDIVILTVVAFVVAFSFYSVIGLDIDGGLLFELPEMTLFGSDSLMGWGR